VVPDLTKYRESQTLFVQDGLQKLASGNGTYFDWFEHGMNRFRSTGGGAAEFFTEAQYDLDLELSRWGRLPSDAIENCGPKSNCSIYPTERLLERFNDLIELMNVSPEERKSVAWLNLPFKHHISRIRSYILSATESNSSLYNKFFEDLYSHQGDDLLSEVRRFAQDENTLFRSRGEESHVYDYTIFPFSKEVVRIVREKYRPPVMEFYGQLFRLVNRIRSIEKSHIGDPVEFYVERIGDEKALISDVMIVRDGWKILVPKLRADGSPIYLSDLSVAKFKDSFVEFFTETKCTFIPTEKEVLWDELKFDISSVLKAPTCRAKASQLFDLWLGSAH